MNLLEKYCPIFHFHPQEPYMPYNIDTFISECQLRTTAGLLLSASPLPQDLMSNNTTTSYLEAMRDFKNTKNPNDGKPPSYPLYVRTNECVLNGIAYIRLMYMIFYAVNDKYTLVNDTINLGGFHYGDWEFVSIFINKDTQLPEKVYLSEHSWDLGQLLNYADLQKVGDQIQVWVAKGSHANYPSSGLWTRIFGFPNDHCADGKIPWAPDASSFIEMDETLPWVKYLGRIGSTTSPGSPYYKPMWNGQDVPCYGDKWWYRFFYPLSKK